MIVIREHIAQGRTIDEAIANGVADIGMDRDSVSVEVLATPKKGFLGLGGTPAQVKLTFEVDMPVVPPVPKPAAPVQSKPAAPVQSKPAAPVQSKPAAPVQPKPAAPVQNKPAAPVQSKPAAPVQTKPAAPVRTEDGAAPAPADKARPERTRQRQPRRDFTPVEKLDFQPVSGTSAESFLAEIFKILDMQVGIEASSAGEALRLELKGENMGLLIGRRGETLDALQYLTSLVVNRGESDYTKVTIDIENYRAKREEALAALANKVAAKVLKNKKAITLEPMNPYERRVIHATLQDTAGVTTASVGYEPSRRVVVAPEGQAPRPFKPRRPYNNNKKKPPAQAPAPKGE